MSCGVHRARLELILFSNWKPGAAFIPHARRSFLPYVLVLVLARPVLSQFLSVSRVLARPDVLDLLRLAVSKHWRQVQEFPSSQPASQPA